MKNNFLSMVVTIVIVGLVLTGCQSPSKKIENARDKVSEAKEKVVEAKQELNQARLVSIQQYKK